MNFGALPKWGEVVLDVVELGMEPAEKFRFLAEVGGEDDTPDNFCVRNEAASWIFSWLRNLEGGPGDPPTVGLLAEAAAVKPPPWEAWLWLLIWDPLPDDGDEAGDGIASKIVLADCSLL